MSREPEGKGTAADSDVASSRSQSTILHLAGWSRRSPGSDTSKAEASAVQVGGSSLPHKCPAARGGGGGRGEVGGGAR